jgi:hypothetical protein
MQPNDLPLICLPTDLSDEAAAQLIQFLYELTEAVERHYSGQLINHYHRNSPSRPPLKPSDTDLDDPPF